MKLYEGDCLEIMKTLQAGSVDMVLCDLPYGTTQNKWDSIIPLEPLWHEYWRLLKPNGTIVLTAAQPFTSLLVASNIISFRYSLVYEKSHATGHLNANRAPMRKHEDVLIFAAKKSTYNPQKTKKIASSVRPQKKAAKATECYGSFDPNAPRTDAETVSFPTSVLRFNNSTTGGDRGLHPTQKPVALMEYLICTYTNEGEIVLDNTMGSGTTGVACKNAGREFIGIERDPGYFSIAKKRIESHIPDLC